VTAFNTVWTHDTYEPYMRPNAGTGQGTATLIIISRVFSRAGA